MARPLAKLTWADSTPAGVLGGILLFVSFAAHPLARRIGESEALARQRGIDLENLAQLNDYIIQNLRESIVVVDGEETELTIPRRCMHCTNPPCVKLCPWGASRQFQNGISRIDTDMCLGGSKCKAVCPWDIPQRQTGDGLYLKLLPSLAGNGIMNKCDRCYARVARDELPACIEACPEDVQTIGPRAEIVALAPEISHELEGRDDCLLCHDPEGQVKPAPSSHADYANEQCALCHKAEE